MLKQIKSFIDDKRGFVDLNPEVLASPGFYILLFMSVGATMTGYIWAKKSGMDVFPLWQLLVIIVFLIGVCYFFVAREQ